MTVKKTAAGWATVSETAHFLGITPQGIRSSYLPSLDPSDVDRTSKPLRVFVPAAIELAVERRLAEGQPEVELLTGSDRPGLERYRLAKAQHAELDLELRKGELIDRERCRSILNRWAAIIRRSGEHLGRRHGKELAELFLETLDDRRVIVEELESRSAVESCPARPKSAT